MNLKPIACFILLFALVIASCDNNRVLDENEKLPDNNWYSKKPVGFNVNIADTLARYNVYLNFRIAADYRYSNLFVILTVTNPSKEINRQRFELTLADQGGKWLGKGLGDIYTYQERVYSNIDFAHPGNYRFEIEQNMRTDKLQGVTDVGLRVEKAN
jgi:gliding motility-associated lipoprotein GldH